MTDLQALTQNSIVKHPLREKRRGLKTLRLKEKQ